jgi:hypothetical protein
MRRTFLTSFLVSLMAISTCAQEPNAKQDPATGLWLGVKKALAGPDGQTFFEKSVKDAKLPVLAGKLISATPADRPTTLILLMPEGEDPEVTLHVKDSRGRDDSFGPLAVGSTISFAGIGDSFVKQPFMLGFEVTTDPREYPPVVIERPKKPEPK